jgi:hypothetical protein
MLSQKVEMYDVPSFPWLVLSSPSEGAKRESRNYSELQLHWIPAFAGMTTFCETINRWRAAKCHYYCLFGWSCSGACAVCQSLSVLAVPGICLKLSLPTEDPE